MRLKAACWSLAVLTAVLMIGWAQFVGLPPKGAPKPVVRRYLIRAEVCFGLLLASFLGTTITAALVVRQTRQEYLRESADNLKFLIEGTLQDHRKKSGSDESS